MPGPNFAMLITFGSAPSEAPNAPVTGHPAPAALATRRQRGVTAPLARMGAGRSAASRGLDRLRRMGEGSAAGGSLGRQPRAER